MSAIDAFTVVAVVVVAVYVAQEDPGVALGIVLVTIAVGLARLLAARHEARPRAEVRRPTGPRPRRTARFDHWLGQLSPPLARYPVPRGLVAVRMVVSCAIALGALTGAERHGGMWAVLAVPIGMAAIMAVALVGRHREYWLYDDQLVLVRAGGYERWPFDRIVRLHHPPGGSRLMWTDTNGRRRVVRHAGCAARVAQHVVPALAARTAKALRYGRDVSLDPPFSYTCACLIATAISFAATGVLLEASDALGVLWNRVSLVHRWASPRGDDRRHPPAIVGSSTLAACWLLCGLVLSSRWRARRVVLDRNGISRRDLTRSIAWHEVRRVVRGASRYRVEGPAGPIDVDHRAWNARLVPALAELMVAASAEATPLDAAPSDAPR